MARSREVEVRDGVELTNLDQPLAEPGGPTKRQFVDYLDGIADRLLPNLAARPLSVIRVRPGAAPFMQKNLPDYAPDWIERHTQWSAASQREVHYPVCNDRRTLLWLANQRAVELHPALTDVHDQQSQLIIDLDPPEGAGFAAVAAVARLVGRAMAGCGLAGAVKSSGSKGLHVYVPVASGTPVDDIAAATRALAQRAAALDEHLATTEYVRADRGGRVFIDSTRAGGATVAACYSPRIRPGFPVSFPLGWDDLEGFDPRTATITTALDLLGDADPWADAMPAPQRLPDDLVAQGHAIPIARVAAMHEGRRRKRADGG